MDHFLKKGDRIRAQWLQATDACLAGMQPKTGAVGMSVVGEVTHIRGDHPTNPTEIRVWVKPDDGGDEVVINPKHIVEILD
jgi:hypothetical protein